MNLPDDLFRGITRSIAIVGQDPAQPAGDRRTPRVKFQTHVAVFPWSKPADAMSVRIRDLSAGGIGILHARRMALDERFVARLPCNTTGDDEESLLLYTVVYWEPLAEDLFAIGARFERKVDEAELMARQHEVTRPPAALGMIARVTQAVARVRLLAS